MLLWLDSDCVSDVFFSSPSIHLPAAGTMALSRRCTPHPTNNYSASPECASKPGGSPAAIRPFRHSISETSPQL